MTDYTDKLNLILGYEKQFAARLGSRVLNKPQLSTWMILIPFIFVFYFNDLSKYKKGLKEFADNYLISRKKAAYEALNALEENRKPATDDMGMKAGLKHRAADAYSHLMAVLASHYTLLLKAEAPTYESLVRSAYKGRRMDFLLFVNQLNTVEKTLNKALAPTIKKDQEGVDATIKKMETGSEILRREDVKAIFDSQS